MRAFIFISCAFLLAACSMTEMVAKILPDDIEAKNQALIEAVFADDVDYFLPLMQEGQNEEAFRAQVEKALAQRTGGAIIYSHTINANVSSNFSAGEGKTKNISIGHEVKTKDGYTLISSVYFQAVDETNCCKLVRLNVQNFDTSPGYSSILLMEKIGKVALIVIPLGVFITLMFFLSYRRKKKREADV